ncbi:MAG: M20 family metallopeptidase [Sedimentisphaerales bacterium]|nr:M20 family metallopeptidase [Sedimentisphaerales bacterium]
MSKQDVHNQISRQHLADDLWELVNVPSPTLNERAAALKFADMLQVCGATVEIDETLPESPNVIGRLKGARPGPTLQLAGHLDHVDIPHPPPTRNDDIISGRGAADMKNGLAGILEITRLLNQWGDFPGELLITAYGRHEAPSGDSQGLFNLIDRGVKGDAAIVFEGPDEAVVVMALGMSIWNIILSRQGQACHEMTGEEKGWPLSRALRQVLDLLDAKNAQLKNSTRHNYPLLPPESVFVGQVHFGDFYNRVPNICTLQGTRRWHPDKSYSDIQNDFSAWLTELDLPAGITLSHNWIYVGDAYKINPGELIVQSLRSAWRDEIGREPRIIGHSSVNDTCRLVARGGVPAVLCSFDTETGHADYEFARLDRMERACRVALATAIKYLNTPKPTGVKV